MAERPDEERLSIDLEEAVQIPDLLPVLAIRDLVLFPFTIVSLSVGRERSLLAIDRALAADRLLLVLAQKDPATETPAAEDLYSVGCVATIARRIRLPDGSVRLLVQGLCRASVDYVASTTPVLEARLTRVEAPPGALGELEAEALVRSIRTGLERASTLGEPIAPEVMVLASSLEAPGRLADLAASNLSLKLADAQKVLETLPTDERLRLVHALLAREISVLEISNEIASQARGEIDRSQREYFLRQQIKAAQSELGEIDDLERDLAEYRRRAAELALPEAARDELDRQLKRLASMHPDAAETSVVRTWLDWLTTLPWARISEDCLDLDRARRILDEDHYDLDEVKQRIIELLAVLALRGKGRAPILCLVGPPGVGKTSLGRSIARALGRRFVRASLGGVRDEAEIRGHRRTYVGALPGRIIQGIHQAGTSNPVFMLDEVDKLGAGAQGDPGAALLEVLDPEQNNAFRDHYLGLDYDLSRVLFITTANVTDPVDAAFLDRMEVIEIPGYSEEEKVEIARRHLVPRQILANGLDPDTIRFTVPGLRALCDGYTREAGLRQLEREIAAVCRKLAVLVAEERRAPRRLGERTVERLLGPPPFSAEAPLSDNRVGVATGLSYTPVGGEVLLIEAVALPGSGQLELTGSLGEVMRESAAAALSLARLHAADYGIAPEFFDQHRLHVHVPSGAVRKDGPSAGVTILTAIVSAAAARPVRHDLAMTGEITLRGDVLAVGAVREKVLAALRVGIVEIVLPEANRRQLGDLPQAARRRLRARFVSRVDEVLAAALGATRAS